MEREGGHIRYRSNTETALSILLRLQLVYSSIAYRESAASQGRKGTVLSSAVNLILLTQDTHHPAQAAPPSPLSSHTLPTLTLSLTSLLSASSASRSAPPQTSSQKAS